MRDVVEHLEQLRPPTGAVRDRQFDVEVIALVQVVRGQRAHDVELAVAGDPAVDRQERDEGDADDHQLEVGHHHADEHE